MREKIACEICRLKDKCNDLKPMVDMMPGNKGRPRMDICGQQLDKADQILEAICSEIEKVENPFNRGTEGAESLYLESFAGFEDCRHKILKLLK